MYKNFAPQTKSFIILLGIAIVGTYLALMLASGFNPDQFNLMNGYKAAYNPPQNSVVQTAFASQTMPTVKPVDTSAWKTYTDKQYGFSFMYDPAWTVKAGATDKDRFYVLQIDPGAKYYNIKIYVSDKSFYAMDGLPGITETIAGQPAVDVSNLLYGITKGSYYYTFDNGLSVGLIDKFNALVNSVRFE